MLRVVKPGGYVLASAAVLLPLIPDGGDYWRLTPEGWRIVLAAWSGRIARSQSKVTATASPAAAAMYGLAHEELTAASSTRTTRAIRC